MATFTFQLPSAETFNGGAENDLFVGSNNFFGAGDRAFGGAGIDEFLYFADPSLTPDAAARTVPGGFAAGSTKTFAAFQLNSVEVVTVTNDSGSVLIFDMSSSAGVTDLVSANSSDGVIFDQVTELSNIRLVNQTFVATADVGVGFQAAALAGTNTTVNLVLQNTSSDVVRIGGSGATLGDIGNTGVENVNLTVIGNANSSIATLDTALTRLTILDDAASTGGVTINNTLAGTVRFVDNQSDGSATINASAATGAVAFTGVGGNDNFTGGAFNDTFNLGNGNNTATTGAGDNTVNVGTGSDTVFAQGGVDTVSTGAGNDAIVDTTTGRLLLTAGEGSDSYIGIGGNFNARANVPNGAQFDNLNMGAGYDVLFIDAGSVDAQYAQVTSAEAVAIVTAGTTTLGGGATGLAQASGINAIFLGSGSTGNDVVNAGTFTTGLSVVSSGSDAPATAAALATQAGRIARFGAIDNNAGAGDDTVTTGSAVDYFLFRGDGNLTSADNLMGGGQTNAGGAVVGDTLVLEGDTTLTGAGPNGFSGMEVVLLESAVGSLNRTQPTAAAVPGFGNVYNLTIVDANAPTTGALFINGSNLKAATTGTTANVAETVTIDASAVTAFALDITTGNAGDTITLSNSARAARVVTQGGNDTVNDGTGGADDVIDVGLGNDIVNLATGNNTVFSEGGNNTINAGSGNDTVFTGGGSDLVVFGAGELNSSDTLADAGGFDAVSVVSTTADGAFAGINTAGLANSQYEALFLTGAGATTLGANAARAGFRIIVGDTADQTINLNNTNFAKAMTVDLSAGGADIVSLGNVTAIAAPALGAPTPTGLFDFIESPITMATWAPPAAGYGAPDTTGNANLVLAGIGDQTINGGTGSDVVRVNNTEWTGADIFAGGAGYDAIQFDLNGSAGGAGSLTATINLTNVTNVELFQSFGSGDRLPTTDADTYTVEFTGGNVGTLTQLKLDNSSMTDANDAMIYQLRATDADYAFNIFGGAAGTTLVSKDNVGTNNNINFQGGAGTDILRINGGDLGSTTIFNGGAGTMDAILQSGGQITDDDYFQVTNVEILSGTLSVTNPTGSIVNAVLGAAASASGLTTIQGTNGNDVVVFDPAFSANVSVTLSGGDDTFTATGASGTLTFNETLTNITAADTIIGGANGADTFNIAAGAGGAADLTNVDGIETYNITANGGSSVTLTLGNAGASTVNGAQTFNFLTAPATAGAIDVTISGATENANTNVTTGSADDQITLGSGDDIINSGGGADQIYGGAGIDTISAGDGNDQVSGEDGNDVIDGGGGADMLRGQDGNDTITGGAGNDIIYGGAGGDILNGGAGNDQYLYLTATNSQSSFGSRDTVTVGAGDVFVFDGANNVDFVGTTSNFQDAQSSTIAGDGILQAVYQSDQNILWVDINDDGALNANDLQILVQLEAGVTFNDAFFANSGDVNPLGGNYTTVAAFEAGFVGPV